MLSPSFIRVLSSNFSRKEKLIQTVFYRSDDITVDYPTMTSPLSADCPQPYKRHQLTKGQDIATVVPTPIDYYRNNNLAID